LIFAQRAFCAREIAARPAVDSLALRRRRFGAAAAPAGRPGRRPPRAPL